ncbi:MAG: cation:proton antiporter [Candidatus Curtissbacteria bacterium]|nr:cation:proton antiporter [Candidatus Curtissbacteria bacterium]
MANVFLQLAVVLFLSSIFGFLVLRFKLPLVVAYLLAGVSLSFAALFDPGHSPVLEILPEIGIAFVLFLIGMELDLREIKSLGKPIVVSAAGQILISTLAGFGIAKLLGFTPVESVYLGMGLAFSSTVVVIKMLLENRELNSLHGKLSIGILLVEDLVAIAALMVLTVSSSTFSIGLQESWPLLALILKAFGLFALTFIFAKYILERIFKAVASSVELLFLTAITWCFVFTSIAVLAGFSVVIGAFLAGVALASSPYHLQIQGKIKPLRDFFVTLFFVYLGTQANPRDLVSAWPTILVFTVFALLLKPLIYMVILSRFGFRKHTLFQTSLNLSQVSEFSLVLLLVGVQAGNASSRALSVMAIVAVISIIASSILIYYSRKVYPFLSSVIGFFEHHTKTHSMEAREEDGLEDHVVIVGAHRIGRPLVRYLMREKIPFVVMDFNPNIVTELREKNINVVYGDIGDPDMHEALHLEKAKLVISTANSMADNEFLIAECKRRKSPAKILVRALDHEHAEALKALGADYVIQPEKVSGMFLVNQLKKNWPNVAFAGLSVKAG